MSCNHLHKIGGICCQKIIPLVFEQSYSYYEQLCAFLHKLNELVEAVNLQNTTIAEFENEVNEAFNLFKNEMRLAFADFQIEMRQEFEDFTTQIETEWNAYKTEINAEWQNEKAINAAFRSDIQSTWNTYRTELNASFEVFKSQETAARQTFETNITNQQNTFETGITQRQTTFENNLTTRQNNFEETVTDELENYSTTQYSPYMGAFSGIQTDPPTISTIANSPIDFDGLICSVYYKSPESGSFEFVKRINYGNILLDSDIPAWNPAELNSTAFIVVFENPVVSEWIKTGITIYGNAETISGITTPRMVIRKFPEITNNTITLGNSVLEGTYTFNGGISSTDYAAYTVEEPMTAAPPYWYTAFCFYGGAKRLIQTITQPTGATTKVFPGYVYDAFRGGVVRDPLVNQVHDYCIPRIMQSDDDINNYVLYDDLTKNPGVIRWICPSSNVRNSLVNLPSDFPNYPDFEIEFRQFKSGGIGIQTITGGSLSSIYVAKRIYKNNSFSSWYTETLTPLT